MKNMKWASIIALLLLPLLVAAGCGSSSSEGFTHSGEMEETGMWKGVTALDYVELCEYADIRVPAEIHTVTDEKLQAEMDSILSQYGSDVKVENRAVRDGDTVNIDYVGRIDGIPFDGGSTGGQGTDVTIGVTSYIDDFLEQLIGHNPGETIDVEVTFPEDYGKAELNGKDAVFTVTIHHIMERDVPELTDAFVADELQETYGWTTVAEMEQKLREDLSQHEVQLFLETYMMDNSTIEKYPASMIRYQQESQKNFYEDYAVYYEMEFEEFVTTYLGAASWEDWLEKSKAEMEDSVKYFLIMQAIVESADLVTDEATVEAYFVEDGGADRYAELQEEYGMPYLKMIVLCQTAIDHVEDQAILE